LQSIADAGIDDNHMAFIAFFLSNGETFSDEAV
jgi:hypothetical protein